MKTVLPQLLDEQMMPLRRLMPLSLSLTRRMTPLSGAVLTLPAAEAEDILPGSFIRLTDPLGRG